MTRWTAALDAGSIELRGDSHIDIRAASHWSFVVVDERFVLVAVPGDAAVESETYSDRLVLRHLLVVEDEEVARAFSEVHSQLWRRAELLPTHD